MYAQHAAHLTRLLHVGGEDCKNGSKKPLACTAESENTFDDMKGAMLKALGLHLLDTDKRFVLRTDPLAYAVGGVKEQVCQDESHAPVALRSRVLAAGQQQTWTLRGKQAYIGLQQLTACTDHQSLRSWHKEHVNTPSGPAACRARWHETLTKLDLTVVYVLRRCITVADCLARWGYPASKGLADIFLHADEADTARAKRIIVLKERLESGDAHCFMVIATPTEGTPSEQASGLKVAPQWVGQTSNLA